MASPAIHQAITEAAAKYRFPEGRVFEYGTAGVSYAPCLLFAVQPFVFS
jgi:phosphoacetylglucosamine mutase